jgi:hypothetical protein
LFELCLLTLIERHIESHGLIHDTQRGFRPRKSCADNILEVLEALTALKEREADFIRDGIKVSVRRRGIAVFFDFQKAFDTVDRGKLINKLVTMNFPKTLIQCVKTLLQQSSLSVQD